MHTWRCFFSDSAVSNLSAVVDVARRRCQLLQIPPALMAIFRSCPTGTVVFEYGGGDPRGVAMTLNATGAADLEHGLFDPSQPTRNFFTIRLGARDVSRLSIPHYGVKANLPIPRALLVSSGVGALVPASGYNNHSAKLTLKFLN